MPKPLSEFSTVPQTNIDFEESDLPEITAARKKKRIKQPVQAPALDQALSNISEQEMHIPATSLSVDPTDTDIAESAVAAHTADSPVLASQQSQQVVSKAAGKAGLSEQEITPEVLEDAQDILGDELNVNDLLKRPMETMTDSEKLALALIPAISTIAGAALGGREGAMIGGIAGAKGMGVIAKQQIKREDEARKRQEALDEIVLRAKIKARAEKKKDPTKKGKPTTKSVQDPTEPGKNVLVQIDAAGEAKQVTFADGTVVRPEVKKEKPKDISLAEKLSGLDPETAKRARNVIDKFKGQKSFKDFQDTKSAFLRVKAAAEGAKKGDPVAQMTLIFAYMKMVDPGSVVREGEFATAENARGVSDTIRNIWNRLKIGSRLNPKQVRQFLNQAENQFKASQSQFKQTSRGAVAEAKRFGVPEGIVTFASEEAVPEMVINTNLINSTILYNPKTGQAFEFPVENAQEALKKGFVKERPAK